MKLSRKARRELSWILLILVGLVVAYVLVLSEGGYITLREHQQAVQELEIENARLKQEINHYWEEIEKLKNDPAAIERLIREHGYGQPNEVIVQIPESQSP